MEQTDDFFVPHVVECTMEEIIEAVRLTPQRCVQEQSVQVMPQERVLEQQIAKEIRGHFQEGADSRSDSPADP